MLEISRVVAALVAVMAGLVLLGAISVVPALAYLLAVRAMDRHDREPLWACLLVFLWGATGATALAYSINTLAFQATWTGLGDESVAWALVATLVAPVTEEVAKAAGILVVAFGRRFDGLVDGIVYGVAVAMGFSALENLTYFLEAAVQDPDSLDALVVLRTLYTMVGHGVATACTGAAVGWAVTSGRSLAIRALVPLLGLGAAIGLHAAGNGLAVAASAGLPEVLVLNLVGLATSLVALFLLMQWGLAEEARRIHAALTREAAFPAELLPTVTSGARAALARAYDLLSLRWSRLRARNDAIRAGLALGVALVRAEDGRGDEPELDEARRQVSEALAAWRMS